MMRPWAIRARVRLRHHRGPRRGGARPAAGALAPPIYQTSTYAQDGVGRPRDGYEYARAQNPTRERLERAVAALEAGRHGIAFASGSAATAALAELAGPGDEMIVGDDVYGGTAAISNASTARRASKRAMSTSPQGRTKLHEALNERTRVVRDAHQPAAQDVDIAEVARLSARRSRVAGGRGSWWTTRSRHPPCSVRSSSARTSRSTRRRSTSRGIPTRSAASS